MILNAYAVLDGFTTLLRLVLALFVIVLALRGWHGWRHTTVEARVRLEDRNYLLFLLAFLLLFLNLASWPILYLLLDSYVPEWPGVMCIYGVMQVGRGSDGMSRFLPDLLRALQVIKPLLVFASGAWVVLYLANRGTARSPLTGRILLVLAGLGALAVIDCAAEAAYLTIPKREEYLAGGCCVTTGVDDARFVPAAILGENARGLLSAAYAAVNGGMILGLFASIHRLSAKPGLPRFGTLLLGAALTAAVSGAFLIDVAAPTWLRLPHHHCAYDLIPRAPESVLGVAAFILGTFAVGWACVAGWCADRPETHAALRAQVRTLLVIGLFGYLGSLAMVVVEFACS